jgi:hypothetical protein
MVIPRAHFRPSSSTTPGPPFWVQTVDLDAPSLIFFKGGVFDSIRYAQWLPYKVKMLDPARARCNARLRLECKSASSRRV